jgi:ferredoxin
MQKKGRATAPFYWYYPLFVTLEEFIMANVTFTSPKMHKDITVHAGDHSTLLAVAREHVIPLECECEDGEFCTCAVQVSPSKARDTSAPWRLACQFIVQDEDILVKF